MNQSRQAGFTLIELIVVIVILGILAAVAIPQFTDTSTAAKDAARQGICSAVASQAVLLYASNKQASGTATIASSLHTGMTAGSVRPNTTNCKFDAQANGETTWAACTFTLPAGVCSGP